MYLNLGNGEIMKIINDRNAGNKPNTYWKPAGTFTRNWCVKFDDGTFLRDKKNRVRRFSTEKKAFEAANK